MKFSLSVILVFLNIFSLCSQNTILWSVKRPNEEKSSYLLGTFHQMGNSFVDEKPQIVKLLTASDIAIFESIEDKNEKIIGVMNKRADDFSYRTYLDKQDVDFLEKLSADWVVPVSKQKPAELLVKLQQEYIKINCGTVKPADSLKHMDDYLQLLAEKNGVKTIGLETYSNQFDAINTGKEGAFTWEKAQKPVHFWVESFQKNKDEKRLCALAREYMKMKFDYQLKVKCAENDPFLVNRNQKWIPKIIETIQQNNTVFVAVGLLHLYGECGIISQLRSRGYEVNPVKLK